MKAQVLVTSSVDSFAKQAAEYFASLLSNWPQRPVSIGLSGGSTPYPVYRELAPLLAQKGLARRCFWLQTDERLVTNEDPRSNQKAILDSLFAGNNLPPGNFFPAPVNMKAAEICQQYWQLLKELPMPISPPAPVDLVICGVGADGHTASLFPDTQWQTLDSPCGFVVVTSPSQPEPRLSMTLTQLMRAKEVVFLVSGAGKQKILEEIFLNKHCDGPTAYLFRERATSWIISPDAVSDRFGRSLI